MRNNNTAYATFLLHDPLVMWNITAWLNDAENTPPATTHVARDYHPEAHDASPKRRRLVSISANSIDPSNTVNMSRTPSPTKRRQLRSGPPLQDADIDETSMPTPVARRSRRPPAGALDAGDRFATRLLPPSDDGIRSFGSTSTHSTNRSKSPMKDAVDLRLADTSIRYCRIGQVDMPKCIEDLCEELDSITDGDELISGDIWVGAP